MSEHLTARFNACWRCAARAAIEDAGLQPSHITQEQLDRTVNCLWVLASLFCACANVTGVTSCAAFSQGVAVGSGIGCLEDVAATTLVLQDMERVRRGVVASLSAPY